MVEILIGIVLGAAFLFYARRRGPHTETIVCAVGLLVAALIYVCFAVARGAGRPDLFLELGGVLLFGLVAVPFRRSPLLVGAGWIAHVGWDVGLHGGGLRSFVPAPYPLVCVGFDLLIAAYLIWRRQLLGATYPRGQDAPPRQSQRQCEAAHTRSHARRGRTTARALD